jgi:hypothetical protein
MNYESRHVAAKGNFFSGDIPQMIVSNENNVDNNVDAASTPHTSPDPQVSEAQRLANKQNAQHSAGAKTQAGRQASSMNALKHGLTAVAACLPGDNAQDYQDMVASHFTRHSPLGDEECEVVQLIADNAWRLHKVTSREAAIFDVGRTEYSGMFFPEIEDTTRRLALEEAKLSLIYAKDLKNLYLQERRIRTHHKEDLARLKALQIERIEKQKREEKEAIARNEAAVQRVRDAVDKCRSQKIPFNPPDFGFDFTTEEWIYFSKRFHEHYTLKHEWLDLNKTLAEYRASQVEPKIA